MTTFFAEGKRVLMRVDGYCQVMAVASTPGCATVIVEALRVRASLIEQRNLMKNVTSIPKATP